MSAAWSDADRTLDLAERAAHEADSGGYAQAIATVGVGRMLGALAEELEALVEVVREHFAPGPCAHTTGAACLGCDHAAHHGSACLAAVIAASGGEETCRCRFDEETATQAAPVALCGMRMKTGSSIRCTLTDRHPAAVLHADDHGNTWSSCCDMTPGHDGECGWRT